MGIYFEKKKLKDTLDMHMRINGKNSAIYLLNRGLRANTYVYKNDDKKFVIKEGIKFHGSLLYEYTVMKQLQGTYFLPQIYGIINEAIIIEEYIYGTSFCLARDYIKLANVLSDLHSIDVEKENIIVCPNCVLELCMQMEELFCTLQKMSNYDKKIIRCINKKMDKLFAKKNTICFNNFCIIHNDLHSKNIFICEDGCRLIDWEQCKLSNYEWDLAHAISCTTAMWTNEIVITDFDKRKFIKKYCENRNIQDVEECINRVFFIEKYIELRCILWALVNHRLIKEKTKIKLYERRVWELEV